MIRRFSLPASDIPLIRNHHFPAGGFRRGGPQFIDFDLLVEVHRDTGAAGKFDPQHVLAARESVANADTISSHEATKAGMAQRRKSILLPRTRCSIFIPFSMFLSSSQSKISRVTTKALNMLTVTPMVRVMPKPLTGPVPMKIRITDEINVVRLESKIVQKALS